MEKQKRDKTAIVQLTQEEHENLKLTAGIKGLSVSSYIRQLILADMRGNIQPLSKLVDISG